MLTIQTQANLSNEEIRRASDVAADVISDRYATREVVGVLENEQQLERTINELMSHGFDRSQISVLANKKRIADTVAALEDDPAATRRAPMSAASRTEFEAAAVGLPVFIAGVGSYAFIIASGGTLAFALAALLLAGAAGGGLGGFLAHSIARRHRSDIERQLANGGLLLWVGVRNASQEATALKTLRGANANDVHVHEIEREWGMKDVPFYDVQPDPFLQNEHRDHA